MFVYKLDRGGGQGEGEEGRTVQAAGGGGGGMGVSVHKASEPTALTQPPSTKHAHLPPAPLRISELSSRKSPGL